MFRFEICLCVSVTNVSMDRDGGQFMSQRATPVVSRNKHRVAMFFKLIIRGRSHMQELTDIPSI